MKLKVSHKDNQINVKSKLSKAEEINQREMEIFQQKLVRGLMRPQIAGKKKMIYCAPEGVTLRKHLKSGISKNDFFLVFAQIVEVTKTIERYGLNINNLVLNLQYVFLNEMTKEVNFIYQPILSQNISQNMFSFFYDVIHTSVFRLDEDTRFINELISYLNCMQFYAPQELENYISKIYPKVYQQIQRQSAGQSQNLKNYDWNPKVYNRETVPLEKEEGTMLLTAAYEEEGTALLNTDEGTTLLGRNEYGSQVYLVKSSNRERIPMEYPVFRIGKDRNSVDYLVENNNAVSRLHAEIITKGNSYYIKDKGSTNGTFVNGKILNAEEEWEIFNGDEIRFANEVFEFQIEG